MEKLNIYTAVGGTDDKIEKGNSHVITYYKWGTLRYLSKWS
ncbi:hypothetical protein IX332_001845 [Porphyromonas levii]|nr:hypothetical protein [Porphyromonas levii]MBR8730496.1 hypothetical protein [Porphyromonas levii]MBR8760543.1 hypothetical protein [Porphyromonas levii]MBR8764604.1 hypothetical protein [Porphyromonas levii]MBR8770647.1 hypothetical protein [Porphyromonas levii]